VFEKFDDFLAGAGLHLDEDLLGAIVGEVAEEVGGGVGVHFLKDVGGASGVERFDDGLLDVGLDLFESLGGDIFVEGAEDGFAFVGSEIFDDVGDVGGMELGQAFVRDLELDAASGIGFDEIDETPGDGAGGIFWSRTWRAARGARPRRRRRAAPRAPISTDWTRRMARGWPASVVASICRSTSLTRTTLRP